MCDTVMFQGSYKGQIKGVGVQSKGKKFMDAPLLLWLKYLEILRKNQIQIIIKIDVANGTRNNKFLATSSIIVEIGMGTSSALMFCFVFSLKQTFTNLTLICIVLRSKLRESNQLLLLSDLNPC